MKTLYLCGAGNLEGVRLAIRINRAQPRWERIIILDDDPAKHGRSIMGVEIAGPFSLLEDANSSSEVANMVTRTTERRWSAGEKIAEFGVPVAALVDPSVDVSGAEIGQDVTVYQNAVIGPEVVLGEAAVVLMGSIVGHGSRAGRCCIVAPNAVVNARVIIGDGVYIGTNSTVLPEIQIGAWATLAAGSVAMQNIPAGATVMGVPAKILIPPRENAKFPGTGSRPQTLADVEKRSR